MYHDLLKMVEIGGLLLLPVENTLVESQAVRLCLVRLQSANSQERCVTCQSHVVYDHKVFWKIEARYVLEKVTVSTADGHPDVDILE